MVCLPCRQLKHTHGKPDSQSCLEFPLQKFRPKFHPSTIQMLALFLGMLLVAQISLSASPTLLPARHSPSVKHNTHFSQPNPFQLLSENCWLPLDAGGSQRVPSMFWSVCCPLVPQSIWMSTLLHQHFTRCL